MSAKALIGAILLVLGIASGLYGNEQGQPTAEERIVSGVLLFGQAMGEDNNKGREQVESAQMESALPFYIIAGVSAALGIALLTMAVRDSK